MIFSKFRKPNTEKNESPSLKSVKRRALVMIGSLGLLVAVIVVGSVAWFTRVSNTTGMTMDVAEFDLRANSVTEDFIINVSDYLTSTDNKAAPGVKGVIPVIVSADNSQTDVTYSMTLDFSNMADEFKQRLRFYYYDTNGVEHTFNPSKNNITYIQATVKRGEGVTPNPNKNREYIYWEWIYELDNSEGWFYDTTVNVWKNKSSDSWQFSYLYGDGTNAGENGLTLQQNKDAFDAFDTQIGLGKANASMTGHLDGTEEEFIADENANGTAGYLYAYQKAMYVKITISGANAEPKSGTVAEAETVQYNAGSKLITD